MSRRTSLSTLGRQQRAASRMTPGTRMWSEQPLQGLAVHRWAAEPEAAVVEAPIAATVHTGTLGQDMQLEVGRAATLLIQWGNSPSGETSATPPALTGWTVLGEGTIGASPTVSWRALYTHSVTPATQAVIPNSVLGHFVRTQYLGGTSGTWMLNLGASRYDRRSSGYAAPPAGSVIWQQLSACCAIHGGWEYIPPGSENVSGWWRFLWYAPPVGSYTAGPVFDAAFKRSPFVEDVTPSIVWGHLAPAGIPGSQPICFGWKP